MPGKQRGIAGLQRHHEEGMNGPGIPGPSLALTSLWDWVEVYGADPVFER